MGSALLLGTRTAKSRDCGDTAVVGRYLHASPGNAARSTRTVCRGDATGAAATANGDVCRALSRGHPPEMLEMEMITREDGTLIIIFAPQMGPYQHGKDEW